MEKLIELLNEYEENRPMELSRQYRRKEMPTFKGGLVAISEYDDEMVDNSDLLVVSKFDGFIKWLVENNKIDLYMLDSKAHNTDIIIELYKYENLKDKDSKRLLMLLAISDTPIEDLINYLK